MISYFNIVLTLSFIICSTVGDIMMPQMTVTSRKYKAYIILVPVDCLIFGQQLQQQEQAAEPQQQASWTNTIRTPLAELLISDVMNTDNQETQCGGWTREKFSKVIYKFN